MLITIVSHPRSGTHFTIDSLLKNFRDIKFPLIRPSFSTLDNLFLPHDLACSKEMWDYTFKDQTPLRIFKTHALPEEMHKALKIPNFFANPQDREVIEHIVKESKFVYVVRDVKDVLTSFYWYIANGGYYHYTSMRNRLKEMTLSEFIRMPNYRVYVSRVFQDYDANRVSYWLEHVRQWKEHADYLVRFEALKHNFDTVIRGFAEVLDIESFMQENPEQPQLPKEQDIQANKTAVMPRKGIVGDYLTQWSAEDIAFAENILSEHQFEYERHCL